MTTDNHDDEQEPREGLDASDVDLPEDDQDSLAEHLSNQEDAPAADAHAQQDGALIEGATPVDDGDDVHGEEFDEAYEQLLEEDDFDPEEAQENAKPGWLQHLQNMAYLLFVVPVVNFLKFIPKTENLADPLIIAGFNLKKQLGRADAINLSIYGDNQVIPRAEKWNSVDSQYVTTNGERYKAESEGHRQYYLFGQIPITISLRAAAEVFEPIQAAVADVRDRGSWMEITRKDGTKDVVMDMRPPEDSDGFLLSYEKAWEMYFQKIDQEDLTTQFKLGKLTELDGSSQMKIVAMVLGAYIGGIATMIAILWILNRFLGVSVVGM